jgi:hypothetical protein
MKTMVWCDYCEQNELVCECATSEDRENGCYEFEESQSCNHKEEGR